MNRTIRFVKLTLRRLAKPVAEQLPFFLISYLLLVPGTLKYVLMYTAEYPAIQYFRYLSLAFLVSYLLTCVVTCLRNWWVKLLAYAFPAALFTTYLYLWVVFKRYMSPIIAILIGETTGRETSEFLSAYMFNRNGMIVLGAISGIVVVAVVGEKLRKSIAKWLCKDKRQYAIGLITLVGLVCAAVSSEVYISLFRCQTSADLERWGGDNHDVEPMDNFSAFLYALYGPRTAANELTLAVKATSKACLMEHPKSLDNDSLVVVLVIGESHIKRHSHLYGYELSTSPCLDREQDADRLFAFTDVVSPYNVTTLCVKNMLCANSVGNHEAWYDTPYVPALFKQAGFDVYMWDNQRTMSEDEVITFALNSFLYNSDIMRLSYTNTNSRGFDYDGELLDNFFNTPRADNKHQMWIFHFMGQHFTPEDRYPHTPEFSHFTADSIRSHIKGISRDQLAEIAYYDNATRYIDYQLGRIIGHLRHKNAVVVYLSDHGEEIYDYRLSRGRTYDEHLSRQLADHQFAIPFVVWCSDTYKQRHPDVCSDLAAARHRPMMSDNTCQLLFRMAQLQTSYYVQERDISRSSYKPAPRLIEGRVDYDRLQPGTAKGFSRTSLGNRPF